MRIVFPALPVLTLLFVAGLTGCERTAPPATRATPDPDTLTAQIARMADYPAVDVEMTLRNVSAHTYYVQGAAGVATDNAGFISNAGAVVTDEGVVIFDALGTPSLAALFVRKLRAVTDQPIRKVIVSHYHADHIYGLQVFRDMGAEIIAPAGAMAYIDSDIAAERLEERQFSLDPWVNEKTYIVHPDRFLREPETFTLGGVEFVISLLGAAHSDGDMTLYVPDDGVLFSGDIIFEGRVPYVGDANTRNWLVVLKQMETRKLAALIPGHGPAAKDPTQAISLTRRYIEKLRTVMGKAAYEMTSFDEAYAAADWSEFAHLPAFDLANRRNAYQVFLAMEIEEAGVGAE